jgi:hypothetical protein
LRLGARGDLDEDPIGADRPVTGSLPLEHDLEEGWTVFDALLVLCAPASSDPHAV